MHVGRMGGWMDVEGILVDSVARKTGGVGGEGGGCKRRHGELQNLPLRTLRSCCVFSTPYIVSVLFYTYRVCGAVDAVGIWAYVLTWSPTALPSCSGVSKAGRPVADAADGITATAPTVYPLLGSPRARVPPCTYSYFRGFSLLGTA